MFSEKTRTYLFMIHISLFLFSCNDEGGFYEKEYLDGTGVEKQSVTKEEEELGVDEALHGEAAYVD